MKRLNWSIGRVEELLKCRDGNTRAVALRTISKDGKVILVNRPIQRCYPLELTSENEDQEVHFIAVSVVQFITLPSKPSF